ncbi:MAG: GAF domain-containing sensor histidine kinase, partial [Nitrospinae bacterium]|nr:GAF domain-containing sensor histidine kinase [Nitrospinota bacterium]
RLPDDLHIRIDFVDGIEIEGLNVGRVGNVSMKTNRPEIRDVGGVLQADTSYPSEVGNLEWDSYHQMGFKSWMEAPLGTSEEPIGYISVRSKTDHVYDSETVNFFLEIGRQLGPAIRNSELNRELRSMVARETAVAQIGRVVSSTLDQDAVIQVGLDAITRDLPYDRAMITRFDATRQIASQAHVKGVSDELAAVANSFEIPISDPTSLEGTLLLQGQPALVNDVKTIFSSLHPLNQQLVTAMNTHAFIAVPLKFQDTMLGALMVDRRSTIPFTQDDVSILLTVGHHIALALHNARAYTDLQTLNQQLEAKVQERTFDLEQANRHLETTNEQLAELNETKSRFLAHCSHELRTPLASIKGFSENLLSGLGGALTTKQKTSLQRIEINADRLARMIGNLLDLSQIEAGKMHLNRSACDLTVLAQEVVGLYHPLAQAKNQRIEVQGPNQGVKLYADPDRVTQILLNLLHNASKFTPEGETILIVTELVPPQEARVSVIDSGPGIPEDAIPKLFDPFFQAHRDHEMGTKGLGLGLAIVQHLVNLHDGTIHVENHQPHGVTFRVQFPCRT